MSYTFSVNLLADNVTDKAKELTALQSKIKKVGQDINKLQKQKSGLLVELRKLDEQYGKSAIELKRLEGQVRKLKKALKKNQQLIGAKKKQINSQKHELENQVKAAYGMGRNEKLKLMLNQQDPALSGRMMSYYDYLNKARLKKISKIENDLSELDELKKQRLKETTLLEKKLKKKNQQRSVFLKTKAKRKLLLAKVDSWFLSKKQQLDEFKTNEKNLRALILSLQKTMDDFPFEEGSVKAFYQLKGSLPWPVKGELIKKFGARRSDSRWDGVLIKAKEGAEIKAVTRGRVVYADWLRGYGLLTIIDHGKGYMTLYAFNQSLYKVVGDWVEVGSVIATVGQSGGQVESGLYFGIRQKGKPVNPVKWCRKVRHGKVG